MTDYFHHTPSRKPTEHHCMADRKPFKKIGFYDVSASLKRNLFPECKENYPPPQDIRRMRY